MTLPLPTPSAPRVRWLNLTAGSLPYFLTQNLPPETLKIVFTPDAETALRLQTAWQFFRPEDNALFLPDWETLPYERFSPHQDLVSERLSVLWQLKNGLADALFVPVATAMQRLAPAPFLLGRTFWLKTGQRLDIAALRQNLVEAGYSAVSNVVAGGEFAVRGGLWICSPRAATRRTALICLTMKSTALRRLTPTASAPSRLYRKSAYCRRTSSPPTTRRKKSSAAVSARK